MTDEEYKQLIQDVKQVIWAELRGTIPPSIDPMRGISFELAAKRAVDLCRKKFEVNK